MWVEGSAIRANKNEITQLPGGYQLSAPFCRVDVAIYIYIYISIIFINFRQRQLRVAQKAGPAPHKYKLTIQDTRTIHKYKTTKLII